MTTQHLELSTDRLATLADKFRSSLSLLRARVRMGLAVEGLAFLLMAFVGFFLVTWPIDRWFRLEVGVRAVLLVAWLGWVVWHLVNRVLQPMAFELDDEELALAVERSDQGIGQKLISAIQFHRKLAKQQFDGDSPQMMGELLGEVPTLLDSINVARAMNGQRTRKSWLILLCCAAFLGLVGSLYGGFGLWAKRNLLLSGADWPRATLLSVVGAEDGYLVVPRGDDFTVEVDAAGVIPESVRIEYEFSDRSYGRESMTQNVGESRFTYTFPGLMDPVTFYAWGGDGETEEVTVKLVDRPALTEMQVQLEYPTYMRRKRLAVAEDATEVVIPRGTSLVVSGKASKKLQKAELSVGEEQVAPATVGADGLSVQGKITPVASGLFLVKMLDTDGLFEGPGRRLMLRVVPDKAPRLVARLRGIGAWITQRARIPTELTATDDFGLQAIKLYWGVGESAAIGSSDLAKEAKAQGLDKFEAGAIAFDRLVRFDLQPFVQNPEDALDEKNPVRPGQFVSVRFKAWDNNEQGDESGQWATSDSYTFKVVTDSELLRELNRRQQELRVQFEKFLKREKADRAEFRELEDPKSPGQLGERIRGRLSYLARQQRALGKRLLDLGRRYAQILDEMVNNRVADGVGGEGRVRALRAIIVDGLYDLGTTVMPTIGKAVANYGRRGDPALREAAESGYDQAVRRMQRILKEMLKLESFTEILTKLKELIRIESRTAEETKKRLDEDMAEILGPKKGTPTKDSDKKPNKKPGK